MNGLSKCRVCGAVTERLGDRQSDFSKRTFQLVHCGSCGYSFVDEPRTDFENIYNSAYYSGEGADPLTNYAAELANARSVRQYEWVGLLRIIDALVGITPETRWLDHGCGLGGAVRFANSQGIPLACGLEDGYAGDLLRREGVPCITSGDVDRLAGTFDIVTSIDVIEHTVDPVAMLREVRALLKPGGFVFVVTGNAEPFRNRMLKWNYTAVPDVHIGFFEPQTLVEAYRTAGLEPMESIRLPGFEGILRYKILKVLGVRSRSWRERIVPWSIVSRLADRRYRYSALPLARRGSSS